MSEVSFTYDGTDFTFFETSNVNQEVGQAQCVTWGGYLATINSAIEDYLLFYSIPDLLETFTCYIGLRDINNVNGDGSEYIWEDGSIGTYRNFASGFPRTNGKNCVRHRYRIDGILSDGWLNTACTEGRNCYFCSKQGITIL